MFFARSTKPLLAAAGLALALTPALAQESYPIQPSVTAAPQPYTYAPQPAGQDASAPLPIFTPDQLDQLVGAIALYPDPLIAQVLPAATYPLDIVRAARFIQSAGGGGGSASDADIQAQDWDPSVKAVAHYPDVLNLLDQNLQWTQQLGQAFIAQRDDLMLAIQRQRARAQQLGNLATTPQQDVLVADDQAIRILPANPDILYVPVYQPSVVYYTPAPYYSSYISFGFGYPIGGWLDLDCDWHDHWFYRPGWTWNHWNDHYYTEGGRLRVRHDFDPHRNVWRRDDHRPLTLPHRQLTDPRSFDHYRGRDPETHRPGVINTPTPGGDRGRDWGRGNGAGGDRGRSGGGGGGGGDGRTGDRGGSTPPYTAPRDHTRSNLAPAAPTVPTPPSPPRTGGDRSGRQRSERATPVAPTPTPAPAPRITPAPAAPAPSPDHTVRGLNRSGAAEPRAHISTPPVHIAAPPAAPSTPRYTAPTPTRGGAPAGGRDGSSRDGGGHGGHR